MHCIGARGISNCHRPGKAAQVDDVSIVSFPTESAYSAARGGVDNDGIISATAEDLRTCAWIMDRVISIACKKIRQIYIAEIEALDEASPAQRFPLHKATVLIQEVVAAGAVNR